MFNDLAENSALTRRDRVILSARGNKMFRVVFGFLFVAGSLLAQQSFLKLGDIKGDSTVPQYKDQIEILGFTYAGTTTGQSSRAVRQTGLNSITLFKRFDVASPKILEAAVKGTHIQEAVLTLTLGLTSAAIAPPFAIVTMNEVIVDGIQIEKATTASMPPMESITLTFGQVEWCFEIIRPDGSGGGNGLQ